MPHSGLGLFLGTTGILRRKTRSVSSVSSEFSERDADNYGTVKGEWDGSKAERHSTHWGRENEGP